MAELISTFSVLYFGATMIVLFSCDVLDTTETKPRVLAWGGFEERG